MLGAENVGYREGVKVSVFVSCPEEVLEPCFTPLGEREWQIQLCLIIMIIIIIIIKIAFKGAIRDFLQSPHSATNCLQHVHSGGPGATVCKSRATHRALITCKCHVTCYLVRRDSSAIKFDRVEITFI